MPKIPFALQHPKKDSFIPLPPDPADDPLTPDEAASLPPLSTAERQAQAWAKVQVQAQAGGVQTKAERQALAWAKAHADSQTKAERQAQAWAKAGTKATVSRERRDEELKALQDAANAPGATRADREAAILMALRIGYTFAGAAYRGGVSHQTLETWRAKDPEFGELCRQAYKEGGQWYADIIRDMSAHYNVAAAIVGAKIRGIFIEPRLGTPQTTGETEAPRGLQDYTPEELTEFLKLRTAQDEKRRQKRTEAQEPVSQSPGQPTT